MKQITLLETGQDVVSLLSNNPDLYLEWGYQHEDIYLRGKNQSNYELRVGWPEIVNAYIRASGSRVVDETR